MADVPVKDLQILIRFITDGSGAAEAGAIIQKYKADVAGAATATAQLGTATQWTAAQMEALTKRSPMLAGVSPAALQKSDPKLYEEIIAEAQATSAAQVAADDKVIQSAERVALQKAWAMHQLEGVLQEEAAAQEAHDARVVASAEKAAMAQAGAAAKTEAALQSQAAAQKSANEAISQRTALIEAQVVGDQQMVTSLQREIAIRKEMVPLMRTGVSEAEAREAATRLVNARAALEEKTAIEAAAAAKVEDTAVTEANTAAMDQQAFVGRKMVSLFDELSRGQRGAMVATFGSLLKETGAGLGVLAGTIALFAAGNALWNYFRRADEEAKKLHDDMVKVSAQVWLEQEQTSEAADTAAQDYFDSLGKIRTALGNVETADSDELKVLNARVTAQKELLQLSEKLELAALRRQKLAPEQEAIAEDAIRRRFGDMTTAMDLAQEQSAIDIKRSAYNKAVKSEPDLYFKAVKAENAATAVKKAKGIPAKAEISEAEKLYQDALKTSGKTQPELDAALSRERAAMEHTQKAFNDWLAQMGPNSNLPEFAGMRAALQNDAASAKKTFDLDTAVKQAQQHYLDLSKKLAEHEDELKELNQAASDAKDAYNQNKTNIERYSETIKTDTEVRHVHEQTAKAEAAGNAAGASTTAAEDIARFIEAGGKASPRQLSFLRNWASEIAGHQVSLRMAIEMAEAGATNINAFMVQVQKLANVLNGLKFGQIQQLADVVSELEMKVRDQGVQLDTLGSR